MVSIASPTPFTSSIPNGIGESIEHNTLRYIFENASSSLNDIYEPSELTELSKLPLSESLEELARVCLDKSITSIDWKLLSGRLLLQKIKLNIPETFSKSTEILKPILEPNYYNYVMENQSELNEIIKSERDLIYDAFAMSTLIKSYLLRLKGDADEFIIRETPQYLFLRVAVFMWYPNMEKIRNTYDELSQGNYIHASPTLYNSGLKRHQLASCFLYPVPEDSMQGISKSWEWSAIISMNSGGIGMDFSNLRHSDIGSHGQSRGIIPWLKIQNEILLGVDQGGKRNGSGTIYLCDWHVDLQEFLDLRKNTGPESMRARDLFYGLMLSDLFMNRVKKDEIWTLMCPNKCKGLVDVYGTDFEKMYLEYEQINEERIKCGKRSHCKKIPARELWKHIILTQIETGMPFMIYKDAANRKSNQKNLGTIRCSNLCTEIIEYSSANEVASCNLASIGLSKYVNKNDNGELFFDYQELGRMVERLVENLNQVIDRNYYPSEIPEIKYANLKHRPLGIGIQGLADVIAELDWCWDTSQVYELNRNIFETIYYHALKKSHELSVNNQSYSSFIDSPASQGILQFDMWTEDINKLDVYMTNTDRYDWNTLKQQIREGGLRNSLLLSPMPTASSSNIMGNNECFEPFTEMIYSRTVLSGQFPMINKHLFKDLNDIDCWNTEIVKQIIQDRGSIKNIQPPNNSSESVISRIAYLKQKYRTTFELSQRVLMDMCLHRARFVCQSQSMNCWMDKPTYSKLSAYHFYGWERGIKTGMYYLRTKTSNDSLNFALDSLNIKKKNKKSTMVCTDEVCVMCQS